MSNENKVEVQLSADATGVKEGSREAADSISASVKSIRATLEGIRADLASGLKIDTSAFDSLATKAQTTGGQASKSITDASKEIKAAVDNMRADVQKDTKVNTSGFDTLATKAKESAQRSSMSIAEATAEMKNSLAGMRADFGKGLKINTTQDLERMKNQAKTVFNETRTAAEQFRAKLAELDSMYKQGAIDAETYSRAVKNTKTSFQQAGQGTSAWTRGLNMLKGAGLAFLALQLGKEALSIMADFEQLEVALTGLYGNQEQGKQAFAWIKQLAVDTPFEVRDLAHSFQTLKSYGIDPMNGSLKAITDMAARTGRGTQGLESATLALGQAWTRTKLQGQDILQMVNVGIPVWDILAKKTGKNASELQKLAEKGQLGRDAILALMQGMEDISGGAAQAQMKTLSGRWSNFKDAIGNALDSMRQKGATDGLKEALKGLTDLIPSIANNFMLLGSEIGAIFDGIVDTFKTFMSVFTDGNNKQIDGLSLFKEALKGVSIQITLSKASIQVAFEVINSAIKVSIEILRTFANVAKAAFSLDWEGVKSAWSTGTQKIDDVVKTRVGNIVKIYRDSKKDIADILSGAADVNGSPKINTSSHINAKTGKALIENPTGTKQTSRIGQWSAQLAEEKVYYQQSNDLREYSKQQELAYWQEVLTKNKVTAAEKVQITRTMANLQLQILKEQKQRENQLTLEGIENTEKLGMDSVAMAEQHAQALVQAGQITQEKLLTMQQQFEDRKFKIMVDAQQRRIDLLKADPNSDPVALQKALDKLQEIQRKHTQTMAKLQDDVLVNSKQQWEKMLQPFSQAFDQSISGMIQGTQTLQQAMANIGQAIIAEFVNMGVQTATHWAATELAKTAATVEGTSTRTAVEQAGANQSIAISAFAAIKSIMNSAWEAMAGAFKALVGIPVVGPALATGAGAAAFATVSGLAGNIASARGGFNIPAGVNPLTQLHEKEMVLPAHIADPMRNMLAGGGAGGGPVHIHAKSDKDMVRVGDLKKLLGQMNRNFVHIKD